MPQPAAATGWHDDLVTHLDLEVGEGIRLHAVTAGPAEGPLVVLLHGFPDFWYSWRHQIPALAAAGHRVVAPDLRGYNHSSRPSGVAAYRMSRLAGDVSGLIAACGAERASVVGHDWGGAVAYATASRRPDLVERLVLCNCPHPASFARALGTPAQLLRSSYMLFFQLPFVPEVVLSARGRAALRWALRSAAAGPDTFTEADLDRYAEAFAEPGAFTGPLNLYRAMGRSMVRRRRPGRGADTTSEGAGATAGEVRAPTLVLWGERDPVLGADLAEPPSRLVPDSRVVRIPEASHWVHADAPDRVNELLLDFLPPPGQ